MHSPGAEVRVGRRSRSRFLGILATAAVLAGSAAAQSTPLLARATVEASLADRLGRVELAFREGDAGALREYLVARTKVRLDLKGLTEGSANYGRGQAEVVLARIFDESPTRLFELDRGTLRLPSPGTAFARGRWVRRPAEGGEVTDTVTLTLRDEDGEWRLAEIRSSN